MWDYNLGCDAILSNAASELDFRRSDEHRPCLIDNMLPVATLVPGDSIWFM